MFSHPGVRAPGLRQMLPPCISRQIFEQGIHGVKEVISKVSLDLIVIDWDTEVCYCCCFRYYLPPKLVVIDNIRKRSVFVLKDLTACKGTLSKIRNSSKQLKDQNSHLKLIKRGNSSRHSSGKIVWEGNFATCILIG